MVNHRTKIFLQWLQLLTLIIISAYAPAQTSKEVKNLFAQAEAYYLYGQYDLANPLYLTIASFEPDNMNIKYKIGNCYLNISDEKSKAIEFLEAAVKNASFDAKPDALKEKRAPLDVYFSLGRAYLINNDLDKAMATLELFRKLAGEAAGKGAQMKNINFVDQQIQACKNAIEFRNHPIKLNKLKLPPDFSQGSVNDNPVISFDGSTIAYTEKRGISNAIFYSRKERGKWQSPVEITLELNAGEDCSTSCLNSDGTELFLYKEDNLDGNIYSSKYKDGKWSPIKKLNSNINTKFFESHASISADGKKLYFTSNRGEGQNLDLNIYVSEKDATGDWGVAKKLGDAINTPFNEDTPFITKDDTVLFFSSEGHNSMGGYDIFRSGFRNGQWSTPTNLGSPINTTDDDKFFSPVNDGLNAYYSMPTDYKKKEIFYLGLGVPVVDVFFDIKGTVSLNDITQKPDESNKIFLTNLKTGDTLNTGSPTKDSGIYKFTVRPGSYHLLFTGINYIAKSVDTTLTEDLQTPVININVMLEKQPEPVKYEKMDLTKIPAVTNLDTSILVRNLKVNDVSDVNIKDADILYYTVQLMALHHPVDVSYFRNISDMRVLYNDTDKFYRYTTGKFATRDEAAARRGELIKKGYPEEIFIKKVSK
jgi:tetratricopeptide (TPR) repeat protein